MTINKICQPNRRKNFTKKYQFFRQKLIISKFNKYFVLVT